MSQVAKILSIEHLTHDVLGLSITKPEGFTYEPGQAVDLSFRKEGWEDKLSCFTFTSFTDDDHLEFVIKTYPDRHRFTNELLSAKVGDEVNVYDAFGDIRYKGDGIFIAGGAGITPFLIILKNLEREGKIGNNKLIFANKTQEDIILKDKFEDMLGDNFINILSGEEVPGYEHGFVSPELIKKHMDGDTQYFYLCAPPPMMKAVEAHLHSLGIKDEFIVKEGF